MEHAADGSEDDEIGGFGRVASKADAAELKQPSHLLVQLSTEKLRILCKDNEVLCSTKATRDSDIRKELLERLNSVATHGRPGPCPRCNSILHVVSRDDGLRLECWKWTLQRGGRKPCGVCQWLDLSSAAYAEATSLHMRGRLLRAGH